MKVQVREMSLTAFISDDRGVSGSLFKLALAAIVFAVIVSILLAVIKPLLENHSGDTIGEAREMSINKTLDTASR